MRWKMWKTYKSSLHWINKCKSLTCVFLLLQRAAHPSLSVAASSRRQLRTITSILDLPTIASDALKTWEIGSSRPSHLLVTTSSNQSLTFTHLIPYVLRLSTHTILPKPDSSITQTHFQNLPLIPFQTCVSHISLIMLTHPIHSSHASLHGGKSIGFGEVMMTEIHEQWWNDLKKLSCSKKKIWIWEKETWEKNRFKYPYNC